MGATPTQTELARKDALDFLTPEFGKIMTCIIDENTSMFVTAGPLRLWRDLLETILMNAFDPLDWLGKWRMRVTEDHASAIFTAVSIVYKLDRQYITRNLTVVRPTRKLELIHLVNNTFRMDRHLERTREKSIEVTHTVDEPSKELVVVDAKPDVDLADLLVWVSQSVFDDPISYKKAEIIAAAYLAINE